jgi:hypothetical protein
MSTERALAEFERLAKEHCLEPHTDHGITGYTIAKYWFMIGWQAQFNTMCDQIVESKFTWDGISEKIDA